MIDRERICLVTNRSPGAAGYALPDRHIRRIFNTKETKRIPYYELEELSTQPGGRELIYHYFYIEDEQVVREGLNINPEPEYFLKESNIDSWLQTSTLDEFKDALDFAPAGVKELIKTHSVSLPLSDMNKINAIKKQLGYDVAMAIKNEQATVEDGTPELETKERRVQKPAEAETGRRTTPKYKVVGRDDKEV